MEPNSYSDSKQKFNNHLANERTFLAWIRTSIGIVGLGFVVVKFSLFVRQISNVLGMKGRAAIPQSDYSIFIGIMLVAFGAMITLWSSIRYFKTRNMLEAGEFYHSSALVKWVTAVIFIISVFLIGYLLRTT